MLIEGVLEDLGVKAEVSYPKALAMLEFDDSKLSLAKIKLAIATEGYSLR